MKVGDELAKVEFRVGELPNDMKMLCTLAGELTNSAKYFASFAKVKDPDHLQDGTFGNNKGDTWQPWKYEERLKVVKEVEKLKRELRNRSNHKPNVPI